MDGPEECVGYQRGMKVDDQKRHNVDGKGHD